MKNLEAPRKGAAVTTAFTAASDTRIDDSDTRSDGGRLERTAELTSFA
jgi:hypothetical protein